MARNYLISFSTTYLTSDGTSTGSRCITDVPNIGLFQTEYVGTNIIALDGTPYAQISQHSFKGLPFSVRVAQMTKTRFETIVALINSALAARTTIPVSIAGDTLSSTLFLNVIPQFPNYVELPGENAFRNEYVFNATFNFVVKSRGYSVTANAGTLTLTGQSATLTQA